MLFSGHPICHLYIPFLLDFTALESVLVPQLWLGFELAGTACRVSLFLSRRSPCVPVGLCAVGGTMKRLIQTPPLRSIHKVCGVAFFCLQTLLFPFSLVFAPFAL